MAMKMCKIPLPRRVQIRHHPARRAGMRTGHPKGQDHAGHCQGPIKHVMSLAHNRSVQRTEGMVTVVAFLLREKEHLIQVSGISWRCCVQKGTSVFKVLGADYVSAFCHPKLGKRTIGIDAYAAFPSACIFFINLGDRSCTN